jgi:hypothetical protein
MGTSTKPSLDRDKLGRERVNKSERERERRRDTETEREGDDLETLCNSTMSKVL